MADPSAPKMLSEAPPRKSARFRRIVLNVHMYGGLLCFGFLILFGISVLNFNHMFAFTKSPASVATWSMAMPAELSGPNGKDEAAAIKARVENDKAIANALRLFATASPAGNWTDAETYRVHLMRPGKTYDVDVRGGTATVTETRGSIWTIIRDLHDTAGTTYADSPMASTWRWHNEVGTLFVIAASISGVYLWIISRRERRMGLCILGAATAASIALMLVVTFVG